MKWDTRSNSIHNLSRWTLVGPDARAPRLPMVTQGHWTTGSICCKTINILTSQNDPDYIHDYNIRANRLSCRKVNMLTAAAQLQSLSAHLKRFEGHSRSSEMGLGLFDRPYLVPVVCSNNIFMLQFSRGMDTFQRIHVLSLWLWEVLQLRCDS